jgi:hypothetical protein
MLNVPFISLDTLYFTPGWREVQTDELRAKLKAALADAPDGWVIDGNYRRHRAEPLHRRDLCVVRNANQESRSKLI